MTQPTRAIRERAKRRCREIVDELADVINRSPLTPHADDGPPQLRGSYFGEDTAQGADLMCGVDYWRYQEFGTRYMRARPHVRPAIEAVRTRYTR